MSILDDGINVMGSGGEPEPEPEPTHGPIVITAPEDGATEAVPLTVTGTADPGEGLEVQGHGPFGGATSPVSVQSDASGAFTHTLDAWPDGVTDGAEVTVRVRYWAADSIEPEDSVTVVASVPAPPEDEPEPEVQAAETRLVQPDSIDPSNYTVAEVRHYLAEHPEDAPAVIAAERAGKNRASLVGTEE